MGFISLIPLLHLPLVPLSPLPRWSKKSLTKIGHTPVQQSAFPYEGEFTEKKVCYNAGRSFRRYDVLLSVGCFFSERKNAMKNARMIFALPCTLGLMIVGVSLVVYAGPCYINTGTVMTATQKGCSENWGGATGLSRPGMISLGDNEAPVTSCAFRRIEHVFHTGTSGNEQAGRMEQGYVTRACFSYQYCDLTGPEWVWGGWPLHPGSWVYKCIESSKVSGGATAQSWEAIGADCPEDPGA